MSRQGIRAGRAFVEVGADDSRLERGLRAAQRRLQTFGAAVQRVGLKVAAAGAAMLAAFGAAAKRFTATGDALDKLSARTGVSVAALQELAFAAEQSGSNVESVERALHAMNATLYQASRGSAEAAHALRLVGLSVADLSALSPEDRFARIAEALAAVADEGLRGALAQKLLGRDLLPMLEGLSGLRSQFRGMGLGMSREDATLAAKIADEWNILRRSLSRVVELVGASVGPVLVRVLSTASELVRTFGQWIDRNRQIVVVVAGVAAALLTVGTLAIAAGAGLSALGIAAGVLASGVAVAVKVFIAAKAGLVGLAGASLLTKGAVAGFATGSVPLLKWFGEVLASLLPLALQTFKGIGDALMAGDLGLAARVAWAGVKLAFLEGTKDVREWWHEMTYSLSVVFVDAMAGIGSAAIKAANVFQDAWSSVVGWVERRILEVWGLFDDTLDVAAAKQISLDRVAREQEANRRKRDERMAVLDAARDEFKLGLDAEYQRKIEDARSAMEEARKEWEGAVADAAQARAEMPEIAAPSGGGFGFDFDLGAIQERIVGTFNAAAVAGLAGSPAEDRIAKATEETARGVKTLVNRSASGGLVMGH